MEYREAGEQDIVGIVYVQATSWIKNYPNTLAKISEDDVRALNFENKLAEWQHILKSANYKVWVAVEGENVLGFIAARADGQQPEIYQQHTLPERTRRGIGSNLLSKAKDWLGEGSVALRIPVYLQQSLDFYNNQGFKVDEMGEVDFIRLPGGKQIPTVLMRSGQAGTSAEASQPIETAPQPEPRISGADRATPVKPASPKGANSKMISRAKLAKTSGVRPSTIKYYTEIGILPFKQAEAGLARRYNRPQALARLKDIQDLRRQGNSIAEIQTRFRA